MSLEFTKNRLANSNKRIERFIDENIVQWVEDEVLGPTQELAFAEGLSQNAIGHMEVLKDGFMKAKLRWRLIGPKEQPLHLFIERGTKPHIIQALGKLFGGADSLMWRDAGGKPIFRKRVNHPGTEDRRIIERGWDRTKDKLKARAIRETNNFLEVNRLG